MEKANKTLTNNGGRARGTWGRRAARRPGAVLCHVLVSLVAILLFFSTSLFCEAAHGYRPLGTSTTLSPTRQPPLPGAAIPKIKLSGAGPFNNDFFRRWSRKLKGSFFSSDLESWMLQLTEPTSNVINPATLSRLTKALIHNSKDIEFIMIAMSKLARKLCEGNVYTKFKGLLVLHHLVSTLDVSVGNRIIAAIISLRKGRDAAHASKPYFTKLSLLSELNNPASVDELNVMALLEAYFDYVAELIEFRRMKAASSSRRRGPSSTIGNRTSDQMVARDRLSQIQDLNKSLHSKMRAVKCPQLVMCSTLLKLDEKYFVERLR
jgi:hypothetical protein